MDIRKTSQLPLALFFVRIPMSVTRRKRVSPHRRNYLALDRVPAARRQEKEPALAPAVDWFAKMLGKIERGIVRFPFVFQGDRLVLEGNARNVFLIENSRILKPRMLEFSLGLA